MFGPVGNLDTTQLFPAPLLVFLFPPLLFSCKKVEGHNAVLLAASRHRLFSDWPVSRCAFGKGGVNPDLPLPAGRRLVGTAGMMRGGGWQRGKETAAAWAKRADQRGGWQRGKETAAAWAKRADQRDTGADMVAARKEGGLAVGFDSGLGEHADEAGGLVAPCLLKAVLIGSCWKCFDSSLSSFPMGMLQLNLNSCGVCEAHIGMSVARWYGGAILAQGVTQAE